MCAVSKERDEKGFRVDGGRETKRETSPMEEERRWTGKQAEESKNQLASLNPGRTELVPLSNKYISAR